MGMNKRLIMLLLAVFLLMTPAWANAQRLFQIQAADVTVEVLPEISFEAQFGDNPDIPRNDAGVIALARKLYPPRNTQLPESATEESECGEYEMGLLFAALQNPAISDATRIEVDQIIRISVPTFDKIRTIGHYKFYYCVASGIADDRVTDAEIDSLATYLNSYWTSYTTNFTKPKHYDSGGLELINIRVYYLGTSLLGQTSSSWNYIELNSKYCVKDASCKRRTTAAHELFHRVQYAYGYISGTANLKWIVEGTASWSQKFTNLSLRDYMGRMNSGLDVPDRALITGVSARSYDACHYWVWLQKRAATSAAIKDVWYQYSINGKNAKLAVQTVVTARSLAASFDVFTRDWNKANYVKDFSAGGVYDYDEDPLNVTTGCGTFSLHHAPRSYYTVASNSTIIGPVGPRSVLEYGADYYEFTINAAVTRFKMLLTRTAGGCDWALMGSKSGAWKIIYNNSTSPKTWDLTFTAGTYDKMGLIVSGQSSGATYTWRVGP